MIQQQHPTVHKNVNESLPEGPIEPEIKELFFFLLQLIAQTKEQQDEMKHLLQQVLALKART